MVTGWVSTAATPALMAPLATNVLGIAMMTAVALGTLNVSRGRDWTRYQDAAALAKRHGTTAITHKQMAATPFMVIIIPTMMRVTTTMMETPTLTMVTPMPMTMVPPMQMTMATRMAMT